MKINNLAVENFKSFDSIDLDFENFNVIVGSNAAGKSNLINLFKFIKKIEEEGIKDSIEIFGGEEYIKNLRKKKTDPIKIQIEYQSLSGSIKVKSASKEKSRPNYVEFIEYGKINYDFSFKFDRNKNIKILKDILTANCECMQIDLAELENSIENFDDEKNVIEFFNELKNKRKSKNKDEAQIVLENLCIKNRKKPIENLKNQISIKIKGTSKLKEKDIMPPFLTKGDLKERLLLDYSFFNLFSGPSKIFDDIAVYDFDIKKIKKSTSFIGKSTLLEDGENLSIVLKKLLENPQKKRKFLNLLTNLLPFVKNIDTEKISLDNLSFRIEELFYENCYLPSELLSDGTINLIAIIIALFFENKDIVIIEEPERFIHPYLISKLVKLMREASEKKQIFITTHSPEVLKHTDIESLLLLSRDNNGYTRISKPKDSESVRIFLENDLGIDELFIDNLLGN